MADEPSLPRLPAVSWDEPNQRFSNKPRKRNLASTRASSPLFNSSDAAVFSSDDDPGLDNYVQGRRKKKRYVGSWFHQQPASSDSAFGDATPAPKPVKRTLARQVDSGVFLGSDGTDNDDVLETLVPPQSRLPQLEKRPVRQASPAELIAREKVRSSLEKGHETIDLWSLGLEELSNETISPLTSFSCIPVVTKDVAFEQKVPELKLYLSVNNLQRVPGALFDLKHLTTLSLRRNKLTELPPAIAKLVNLRELNISENRLRSVPAELLDLLRGRGNLCELLMHPNPFDEPDEPLAASTRAGNDSRDGSQFAVRFVARSPLQLSDSRGEVISAFKFPSGDRSQKVAVERADDMPGAGIEKPSKVPSLVEASLRSCYGSSQLSDLQYYMPEGLPHLRGLLKRAAQQRDAGGVWCTQCKRPLIVPTVEWLEWHEVTNQSSATESSNIQEPPVPFRHRACSWRCSAGAAAEGETDC